MKKVLLLSIFIGCGLLVMRNFYAAEEKKKKEEQSQLSAAQLAELGDVLEQTQLPKEILGIIEEYADDAEGGYEHYASLQMPGCVVRSISFSPDGKYAALISSKEGIAPQQTIHLYNVELRRDIKTHDIGEGSASHVVFSLDGNLVAFSYLTYDRPGHTSIGVIGMWNHSNNKLVMQKKYETEGIHQIKYTADGSTLMWVSDTGKIYRLKFGEDGWQSDDRGTIEVDKVVPAVQQASFSPDGRYLALNVPRHMGDSFLGWYDLQAKNVLRYERSMELSTQFLQSLSISFDSRWLVVVPLHFGIMSIVDTIQQALPVIQNFLFEKPVACAFFSPTQLLLAAVLENGVVELLKKNNEESWELMQTLKPREQKWYSLPCGTFSPDGRLLAILTGDRTEIWCQKNLVKKTVATAKQVRTKKTIKEELAKKSVDRTKLNKFLGDYPDLYRQAADELIKEGTLGAVQHRCDTMRAIAEFKKKTSLGDQKVLEKLKAAYPEYFKSEKN